MACVRASVCGVCARECLWRVCARVSVACVRASVCGVCVCASVCVSTISAPKSQSESKDLRSALPRFRSESNDLQPNYL